MTNDQPTDQNIEERLMFMARQRGPEKTLCPSEVARQFDSDSSRWRSLMPAVRSAAGGLVDRGLLVVMQKGAPIDLDSAIGPIRLHIHDDQRDANDPVETLMNIGPACRDDLQSVDIQTLGDLRDVGALKAFELIMVAKLHLGQRKGVFHPMYLYALYGALHDQNCLALPLGIRQGLQRQAAAKKTAWLGK